MRRFILSATVALSLVVGTSTALAGHHYRFAHHHECQTLRCAHNADHLWAKHHRPKVTNGSMTAFDRCVAFHESSGNAGYDDGTYHGLYNFDHETWMAAGGGRYGSDANDASPAAQTAVFHYWSSIHPEAWPQTIPMCR